MKLQANGIMTLDDWFKTSPPMGGEKQWRDGRSAKELARYITSALPNVPTEIEAVLSKLVSHDSAFAWDAEYVTDFVSHNLGRGEGRNHDAIMVNDEIFVGIEGKADESLGSLYVGTALIEASDNKKTSYQWNDRNAVWGFNGKTCGYSISACYCGMRNAS